MNSKNSVAVFVGLLLVCGFFIFQPRVVTTFGTSMEPVYFAGDLIVSKGARSLKVGEVAVYVNPEYAGLVVAHRVIGTSGEQYITKGDNNSWVDTYRPTSQDIIGVEWFVIPGAGKWLNLVTSPAFLGGLAFFLVIITWVGSEGRRTRRRLRRDNGRAPLPDWM